MSIYHEDIILSIIETNERELSTEILVFLFFLKDDTGHKGSQLFTEMGTSENDTGEGEVKNQEPSEDSLGLDNTITAKLKAKCI